MREIISIFIFFMLVFSNFFPLSSEDAVLYSLEEDHILKDIAFDPHINSIYLAGNIKDSNNSFVIKSNNGQFLREQILEDFKIQNILNDNFSNTYLLGLSKDGDKYLIKLTSSLSKRWEVKIKFSDMDAFSSFTVNDNQEVTVVGYSTYKRESDSFIVKIDRNGSIISSKILDIGPYERPYQIIEDYEGNFYIAGESKDKNFDMFVCKLTKDLELIWVDYFDNDNWEDGGLCLELINEDVIAVGYSGNEGWYVFDTVFFIYSPEGNASTFTRKNFSEGSDWVKQFKRNGNYYYAILWDILTGKEYALKLDYYFDILKKEEIKKDEIPLKIINIVDDTYFVFLKENTVYSKYLE
ncbi:MAG: hypothetical protein APG12_00184 [Candidatus Methanofastidiosum methylothiophilum]|uniref:Beta propeller domain protein n=1 Tax=Candidatus Methanofastidiosum methylothiophilum TaxID=1705564 RepID=A0A150J208_9EURY|nr:MAG: hypothetical protein APG10_00131 [Candidatus Methanofastidiosum methylthiophilus]KYC48571.1 MAG: hypothetical protein APG11_00242 [Candidatus Methanofastidiosum methylthiophilus]KYC51259.1 MAG: hypothetical protein APG12_00184 [Candidatus Methanofastidiosum methylthiophilus]